MKAGILSFFEQFFLGERFQEANAIPKKLAQQLFSIPRLTNLLPYVAWMPVEQLFVLDRGGFVGNDDGDDDDLTLGFALETMPQTGANDEMERILVAMFLAAPPGSGIQVTLYGSPHILPTLKRQANMMVEDEGKEPGEKRNKKVFRAITRRRIDYYLKGAGTSIFNHTDYLLRDYRCVISVSLPLSPKKPGDVEKAVQVRESMVATLRSAYLPSKTWNAEDLINFVADFFDHDRIFNQNKYEPIKYDDTLLIRQQVSNPEIASTLADNAIRFVQADGRETVLQSFYVRQYPKYYRLAAMSTLIGDLFQQALSIPCPFVITMGAIIQDYESARSKAQLKAARATQLSGSMMAYFDSSIKDRKHDWDMVLRAFDNGRSVVQMYHQVLLVSDKQHAAKAEYAVRGVWRPRGFDLAKDVYLQHQGLTAALPCTLTPAFQKDLFTFGKTGTKTADNAVMTSPFLAEWKGTTNPVITLFGRRGQIMGFDLFDNTGGNYNFAVAALSGSGKSVFVNELTFRYLGTGAKVWIIDVGRSYENICSIIGGEYIVFGDPQKDKTICINPFSMVIDINNDMEMLLPLIAQMASPRSELSNFEYAALSSAIKKVWDAKGNKATITDIYNYLLTSQTDSAMSSHYAELQKLAVALEPYTAFGVYAPYFEGEANIEFYKNFIVLELEELKSKKDLQTIVMQLIMYKITQEMYLDRSRKKLVIIDEAWDLMGGGASAAFIESGYRRARKYGGSFGTITQSVEDYYKNEATKACIQNADWLFLLRQKPESIDRLGQEGKLSVDEFSKRLLASVSTEHGMYSEIYVHSPMGSGIGRLLLDPFSMLMYSTRAEDYQAINELKRRGYSTVDAINEILKARGITH